MSLVSHLPSGADLRRGFERALSALIAGQKRPARSALRAVRRALAALEQEAARACRAAGDQQGAGSGRAREEAGGPCAALSGITAVRDEMADRLDPDGPLAEQLDVLGLLRRRLGERLGVVGLPAVPFSASARTLRYAPLAVRLGRVRRARRRATSCWPERRHRLDRWATGAAAVARVGGRALALWWSEGPAGQQGQWRWASLSAGRPPAPRPLGAGHRFEADQGAPVRLLRGRGDSVYVAFGRDGDTWVMPLRADPQRGLGPAAAARPVLARGDALGPEQGVVWPRPAWLSRAGSSGELVLRLLETDSFSPAAALRVLAGSGAGSVGRPALLGLGSPSAGSPGFVLAAATLDALHVAWLDARGRARASPRRLAWPRGRRLLPECVLLARRGPRVAALGVGAVEPQARPQGGRGGRRGAGIGSGARSAQPTRGGLLALFGAGGVPERLPVMVPIPGRIGCPARLVLRPASLLLVGTRRGLAGPGRHGLAWLEIGPDGSATAAQDVGAPEAHLVGTVALGDRLAVLYHQAPVHGLEADGGGVGGGAGRVGGWPRGGSGHSVRTGRPRPARGGPPAGAGRSPAPEAESGLWVQWLRCRPR